MPPRPLSPPGPQEPRRERRPLALALATLGVLILFVGLLLALGSIARYRAYISANLVYAQQALLDASTPDPEIEQLRASLSQIEGLSTAISAMDTLVATQYIDWPGVVDVLAEYNPGELALGSVVQEGVQIQLTGCAVNDAAVVAYAQALESSQRFTQVLVQSINLVNQPCVALSTLQTRVPGSTTPTSLATALPTATFADAYEPDDQVSPAIFLNQAQTHTFCPNFDIDRVRLLVKAGRHYRLLTSDLGLGVDTRLIVYLEGDVYANDDRQPGDLSSEITFFSGRSYDVEAIVEISNRGEYGPSQSYTLTALETVPTPTATPTATTSASTVPTTPPSPSATNTLVLPTATLTVAPVPSATYTASPSPTTTQVPSITPTPTFDLRDPQEPDDYAPRDIVVGETYNYSFYPDFDIDQARFMTQVGHRYRIYTSHLSMDVDTQLTVQVGGVIYANDNRSEGDPSSEVVADGNGGQALILVLNRGRYGPAQWYKLTVEDMGLEPAPTEVLNVAPHMSSARAAALVERPSTSPRRNSEAVLRAPAGRGPGLASVARAKATATPEMANPDMPGSVEFVILLTVRAATE